MTDSLFVVGMDFVFVTCAVSFSFKAKFNLIFFVRIPFQLLLEADRNSMICVCVCEQMMMCFIFLAFDYT